MNLNFFLDESRVNDAKYLQKWISDYANVFAGRELDQSFLTVRNTETFASGKI